MSTKQATKILISEIEKGDIFSEESHYIYEGWNGSTRQFKHLESGQIVNLDEKYVENLLVTADQFSKEEEIGKEDKFWTAKQLTDAKNTTEREGDLKQKGIRSIWADIHSAKVFTVCFNKQGKELSAKAVQAAKDAKIAQLTDAIDLAMKNKKGVANTAKLVLKDILDNPITMLEKGEERILRGYKVQFSSINGSYDVVDMDIAPPNNRRKVNVNEINWLVIDGVKYIVK